MKKGLFIIVLLSIAMSGCVTLKPTSITRNDKDDFSNYKYFYVNTAGTKTSGSGVVVGNQYGVYGGSSTKSIDPCDVITGFLIRKGYIRVAEINDSNRDETFVINYGEIGKRTAGFAYTFEVVLQFISANANEVICTVTGEGYGETEADGIRRGILRCLDTAFPTY